MGRKREGGVFFDYLLRSVTNVHGCKGYRCDSGGKESGSV